ncbi:MAG TPA: GDP-mannose 4,6-dehydratase [Solirubrobacterales bacterium]|nr:GDP-mannose 4,6-dehydratase [Solirubrobacterales bacterium]
MGRRAALITGITGQDGSYLAELLLDKGYEVHGLVRGGAAERDLGPLTGRVVAHRGELGDGGSLLAALRESEPDEVYNLAAVSHVPASSDAVTASADVNALGVGRLLAAIVKCGSRARFFQASSSEMFPHSAGRPQDEATPLAPRSAYGVAKAYGHLLTADYRRHGLFACSGILFNHESPRRGPQFVSRRVVQGAVAIKLGRSAELALGNLDARRDWGYAPEYVEAMWLMLQAEDPEDYVIGSGHEHSVAELVAAAFGGLDLEPERYLRLDPAAAREHDLEYALADPTKARERLGWSARTGFDELVRIMVAAELAAD